MWLQQLDVLESCCVTLPVASAEVDSSRLEVRVAVQEDDQRHSVGWVEEICGDDELSQYVRSEEEICVLQRLEQT